MYVNDVLDNTTVVSTKINPQIKTKKTVEYFIKSACEDIM